MFDERENNLLNNPKKIFAVVLCRNLAYAHLVIAAGIMAIVLKPFFVP